MTLAATVSTSFTATGVSAANLFIRGTQITLGVSGTYAATIQFERAKTPDGTSWEIIAGPYSTANATVAATYTVQRQSEMIRARCFAFTSGTAVATYVGNARQINQTLDVAAGGTVIRSQTDQGVVYTGGFEAGGPAVAAGSTLQLVEAVHAGTTIKLDTLAGSTVTLPLSTGNGAVYRFVVSVVNTSNSHVIQCEDVVDTDVMKGLVWTEDGATVTGYVTSSTSNTITLNGTTTGGLSVGDYITVTDAILGKFLVQGFTSSSGTAATPFSAE